MGKGTIISGGTDGLYSITLNYNRDQAEAEIIELNVKITAYEAEIAAETDETAKARLELLVLSAEKRIEFLGANIPDDPTVSIWCADLTEDASGSVGTMEVPGEESGTVMVRPGGEAYSAARDGVLVPLLAQSPEQTFFNISMTPGWQKWQPLWRFGTITDIDGGADTADVTLDAATSSQQNLAVNQTGTISDVPISYLTCDSEAFDLGDEVLIEFTGQDWDVPVIIGFKDNPQACGSVCPESPAINYNWCMEAEDGWVSAQTAARSDDLAKTGTYSWKLTGKNVTAVGDKFTTQTGVSYTLSGWIRNEDILPAGNLAKVVVRTGTDGGAIIASDSVTSETLSLGGWHEISAGPFTDPTPGPNAVIDLVIEEISGFTVDPDIYFDDVTVASPNCESAANLVPNGCMELLTDWTNTAPAPFNTSQQSSVQVLQGSSSWRLSNDPGSTGGLGVSGSSFSTTIGVEHRLEAWIYLPTLFGAGSITVGISGVSLSVPIHLSTIGAWFMVEATGTALSSLSDVGITMSVVSGAPGLIAYIDNISLIPT